MLEVIAIVDGYSTGRFFAPKLIQLGYQCIHVQSSINLPQYFISTFNPEHYIENIVFQGNLADVYEKLSKYNIKFLFSGAESGVELSDKLSFDLGLVSNGVTLSAARRDKGKMIDALSKKAIKTAKYLVSDKVDEILSWAKNVKEKPIVLKPLRSMGADLVTFCNSDEEICNNFKKIITTKSILNEINTKVLAQSYLNGTQLLVNTVSANGVHIISDIWKCGTPPVTNWILPYNFKESSVVVDYTFNVLNALGISNGPCHSEIMLTEDGPILIECGARVMGCFNAEFIMLAIGRNQVNMTIDSYLNPKEFISKYSKPYHVDKFLFVKFFESQVSGIYKGIKNHDKIKRLASFYDLYLKIKPGDSIKRTIDQFTSPGSITFMNSDEIQLNRDIKTFMELEKDMFAV